jgi:predicted Zn finger-like uncharacterized protein
MRITCPSCAAEYEVGTTLAAGRAVRCVRCGAEWAPVPAVAAVPVAEATPPLPDAVDTMTAPAASRPFMAVPIGQRIPDRPMPSRNVLVLAWFGSAVLIVAVLVAAYLFRAAIMQAWPPSARLYGALGLG